MIMMAGSNDKQANMGLGIALVDSKTMRLFPTMRRHACFYAYCLCMLCSVS